MDHIENLRKEMIRTGLEKGFTHSETIKLSQQLDSILNVIQRQKLRSLLYTKKND